MSASFGNARWIASGMLAAALAVMVVAPAEAQPLRRSEHWQRQYTGGYGGRPYGGRHYYSGHRSDYAGYRSHYGGGAYVDGGLVLGILGLGLVVDAIVDSQRPVVVYQPQAAYRYQQPADLYPQPYAPDYPPPARDYPECREFVGNPGAMAFCEKGVLEREYEEQKLLERRAYEAGRGR